MTSPTIEPAPSSDASDIDSPFTDSDDEGQYFVRYHHVLTKEIKKIPDPLVTMNVDWDAYRLPAVLPITHKSASSTVLLLREYLPRITKALRIYYDREKFEEKPEKRSWTIICPMADYSLFKLLHLLCHARQANGLLSPPLVKKLNAAHKVVLRAVKIAPRVQYNYLSNAGYLELYYEVIPKALETLTDLIVFFNADKVEGSAA